jgi:hypothetical protein
MMIVMMMRVPCSSVTAAEMCDKPDQPDFETRSLVYAFISVLSINSELFMEI